MENPVANAAVDEFIGVIVMRLEHAGAVAKAAGACMAVQHRDQAVSILLDIEQPLYEAGVLLNAASLINRCAEG